MIYFRNQSQCQVKVNFGTLSIKCLRQIVHKKHGMTWMDKKNHFPFYFRIITSYLKMSGIPCYHCLIKTILCFIWFDQREPHIRTSNDRLLNTINQTNLKKIRKLFVIFSVCIFFLFSDSLSSNASMLPLNKFNLVRTL